MADILAESINGNEHLNDFEFIRKLLLPTVSPDDPDWDLKAWDNYAYYDVGINGKTDYEYWSMGVPYGEPETLFQFQVDHYLMWQCISVAQYVNKPTAIYSEFGERISFNKTCLACEWADKKQYKTYTDKRLNKCYYCPIWGKAHVKKDSPSKQPWTIFAPCEFTDIVAEDYETYAPLTSYYRWVNGEIFPDENEKKFSKCKWAKEVSVLKWHESNEEIMSLNDMADILCDHFTAERGHITEFYESPNFPLTIGASIERNADNEKVIIFNLFYKGGYINISGSLKTENGELNTHCRDFIAIVQELCKAWNDLVM